MPNPKLAELVPVLQTAIGPVILISGIGLLLLTMTNRLGRVIDRTRLLAAQLQGLPAPARESVEAQLRILWSRARRIRSAIALASTSAFMAAVLIIVLFITALFGIESAAPVTLIFVVCMLSLIGSLLLFTQDVNQSLRALERELQEDMGGVR